MQNSPRNTNSALPVINGDRLFLESKKIRQDKTRQDKTRQFLHFHYKKGVPLFQGYTFLCNNEERKMFLPIPRT